MRVAQLGAYDTPWLQGANDALWAVLARHLVSFGIERVPDRLDRERDMEEVWAAPDMLLSQTCGYPMMTELAGRVRFVSTPLYRTPFAKGEGYSSAIIVNATSTSTRVDELRGGIVGVNAWNSNSGMNLLRAALAPLARRERFFSAVRITGSHQESLAAVAAGEVDVAAIDGVTMALTARHRPDLVRGVRVIATTPEAPGLPLITRVDASDETVALLRAALDSLTGDPTLHHARDAIGLEGFVHTGLERYDRILDLERQASDLGYEVLG